MYVDLQTTHPYGTDSNLPISVADQKTRMRVTHTSEDDLIKSYIRSAAIRIEQFIGRSLVEQQHILTIDSINEGGGTIGSVLGIGAKIYLGKPPIIDVESVVFINSTGTDSTVDSSNYFVDKRQGRIIPTDNYSWSTDQRDINAIVITYTSGMVEAADVADLDPTIIDAVSMLASTLYENRGGECEEGLPGNVKTMIRPYKLNRVGRPFMGVEFNRRYIRSGSIGGY